MFKLEYDSSHTEMIQFAPCCRTSRHYYSSLHHIFFSHHEYIACKHNLIVIPFAQKSLPLVESRRIWNVGRKFQLLILDMQLGNTLKHLHQISQIPNACPLRSARTLFPFYRAPLGRMERECALFGNFSVESSFSIAASKTLTLIRHDPLLYVTRIYSIELS